MAAMTVPGAIVPCRTPTAPILIAATVAMLSTMFMTGCMSEISTSTRYCVSQSSSFDVSKREISRFSWTKALTTREPATSSCMMVFIRSRRFCRSVNSGSVFHKMNTTSRIIIGSATAMIVPKLRSSVTRQTLPAMKNMPQRILPRIICMTMFWTCVTSLVIRVMREPTEKRSVCSWERYMTRRKTSLRISFP